MNDETQPHPSHIPFGEIPFGEIHRWDGSAVEAKKILMAVLKMEPGDAVLSFNREGSAPIILRRAVIESIWERGLSFSSFDQEGGPR